MYFVQFYQKPVPGYGDKPIEATGDRGVVILDGREARATHHAIARVECAKRGYEGYTLHKGDAFSRATRIADYRPVPY